MFRSVALGFCSFTSRISRSFAGPMLVRYASAPSVIVIIQLDSTEKTVKTCANKGSSGNISEHPVPTYFFLKAFSFSSVVDIISEILDYKTFIISNTASYIIAAFLRQVQGVQQMRYSISFSILSFLPLFCHRILLIENLMEDFFLRRSICEGWKRQIFI